MDELRFPRKGLPKLVFSYWACLMRRGCRFGLVPNLCTGLDSHVLELGLTLVFEVGLFSEGGIFVRTVRKLCRCIFLSFMYSNCVMCY